MKHAHGVSGCQPILAYPTPRTSLDDWQRDEKRKWRRCPDLLLKIDSQDEQAVYSLLYDKFLTADQALQKYPAAVERSEKVQQRVGIGYKHEGKYKKAIAVLEKCVAAHPSAKAYELLAIAYWDSGDGEKFRQCMEAVQQLPDTGLTHSNYYQKMASHYGRTGEWAKARQCAEKSADSYAAWALNCAAFYCAMDGDFDKATRYSSQRMARYGRPKNSFVIAVLKPAKEVDKAFLTAIEKGLESKKYSENRDRQAELFSLYWWEGKHGKAIETYEKYYNRDRGYINWNLIYAVTIGRQGNTERRDQTIGDVVTAMRAKKKREGKHFVVRYQFYLDMASAWQAYIQQPVADNERALMTVLSKWEKTYANKKRTPDMYFIIGGILENLGKREKAIRLYKETLSTRPLNRLASTMVFTRLYELGCDPIKVIHEYAAQKKYWPTY